MSRKFCLQSNIKSPFGLDFETTYESMMFKRKINKYKMSKKKFNSKFLSKVLQDEYLLHPHPYFFYGLDVSPWISAWKRLCEHVEKMLNEFLILVFLFLFFYFSSCSSASDNVIYKKSAIASKNKRDNVLSACNLNMQVKYQQTLDSSWKYHQC